MSEKLLRLFLQRCVRSGTLNVETASGRRFTVGDGSGDAVAIKFADRAAERELVLDPAFGIGDLITSGRLTVTTGSVYALLDLVGRNLTALTPPGMGRINERLRTAFRGLRRGNSARRSIPQIAHHYDRDLRLYQLFLDPDLQYSCAYFDEPDMPLAAAQQAKKRHIAAKLLLEPGQRVLDVGCGWGGLGLYLAETCGASVMGITLSEEQLAVARRRAAASRQSQRLDFSLTDYREVEGPFDRIVSVGMFEHVGLKNYPTFFDRARRLLADDGVMLLHAIGRLDGASATNPWIERNIFPGGFLPALSEVTHAIEKSGLVITDLEILRLHYAKTLAAWREAFLSHRARAVELFGETFCRMWEFYLAASEASFRYGNLIVFQFQLAKRLGTVPLTRTYIEARERSLRLREREGECTAEAAE